MSKKIWPAHAFIGAFALAAASQVHAVAYSVTALSSLDNGVTLAKDINNVGQIVGWSRTSDGLERAVLWQSGQIIRLQELGQFGGTAEAINDAGVIAGTSHLATGYPGNFAATTWTNGQATNLGSLGGSGSIGHAINEAGQVAGYSYGNQFTAHATSWSGGVITDVDQGRNYFSLGNAIDGSGRVAGGIMGSGVQAAYWQDGNEVRLSSGLGGSYSQVMAMNEAGVMAGYGYTASGDASYAIVWNDTTPTLLGTLSGYKIFQSRGINNQGLVVGYAHDGIFGTPYSNSHAVLWQDGVAIDLNSLLDPQLVSDGWVLNEATDINDAGWIIGQARNSLTGQEVAFLMTPVPEPGATVLALIGTLIVGVAMRRRRAVA